GGGTGSGTSPGVAVSGVATLHGTPGPGCSAGTGSALPWPEDSGASTGSGAPFDSGASVAVDSAAPGGSAGTASTRFSSAGSVPPSAAGSVRRMDGKTGRGAGVRRVPDGPSSAEVFRTVDGKTGRGARGSLGGGTA